MAGWNCASRELLFGGAVPVGVIGIPTRTLRQHVQLLGLAMDGTKSAWVVLAVLGMGSGALAQGRPLTLQMTCYGARELVSVHGAIVLNTSPTTYDRYVAAGGQCVLGEVIEPAWVPTADTQQCPIGYRCVTRTRPSQN